MTSFVHFFMSHDVVTSRLLDILAGRKDTSRLSGVVLVNGVKQPENFKCMTGYVVQVSGRERKLEQTKRSKIVSRAVTTRALLRVSITSAVYWL